MLYLRDKTIGATSRLDKKRNIFELLRNRVKDIHVLVNPELSDLFRAAVKEEGVSVTGKLEEFMVHFLQEKGKI